MCCYDMFLLIIPLMLLHYLMQHNISSLMSNAAAAAAVDVWTYFDVSLSFGCQKHVSHMHN